MLTKVEIPGSVPEARTLAYRRRPPRTSGIRMFFSDTPAAEVPASLRLRREQAERIMNALRAGILVMLALAAAAYSASLPPRLDLANLLLLAPTLAWTCAQYLLWYRKGHLPEWLPLANAVVDITAVTGIIGGYALAESGVLALRSPVFLMYFVVLAARPVASSVRKATTVGALAFAEYGLLLLFLIATRRVAVMVDPVAAVRLVRISVLDEGAKLMFLAIGGVIAVYATRWVEHLAIESATESTERQRVATRLVQAELDTLKLQLSPHFLFNALNSAIALIGTDSRAAERMVTAISDFLRLVLNSSNEQEVTLERELSLLHYYLDIQRVRFGDKLRVNFDVDDSLGRAVVPSLILQPLVENAIRHGIGPRLSGGVIEVRVHGADGVLLIDIIDDGLGVAGRRSRERSRGTGLGLANTATRLNHLYGSKHTFETGPAADGGFAVHLTLPLRYDKVVSVPSELEAVGAAS